MRHVLVISHEASRTGAPKVALDVVRSLRTDGWLATVVLRWGGPLEPAFAEVASRFEFEPLRRLRVVLRRARRARRFAVVLEEAVAAMVLRRHRPDLLWLNTVKSASYVRAAARLRIPTVLHVHELEPLASETLRRYRLTAVEYGAVRLVACSPAVAENLVGVTGVPLDRIEVLSSSIDVERLTEVLPSATTTRPGEVLVGSCGLANAGKGADLWLEMVTDLVARVDGPPMRFSWVGRDEFGLGAKVAEAGLSDRVHLVGAVDDAAPLIAAFDVFVLPSRQDSFPLVVLEAMALSRPIVAFGVGDVPAQVGDAGMVVEPGDVRGLANAVCDLASDPSRRAELGAAARRRLEAKWDAVDFERGVVDIAQSTAEQRVSA